MLFLLGKLDSSDICDFRTSVEGFSNTRKMKFDTSNFQADTANLIIALNIVHSVK